VIIDALDVIEDEGGSKLLKDLFQAVHQKDLRGLKFLVTSLPDPCIVTLCTIPSSGHPCVEQQIGTPIILRPYI
jgi:hypothetical protein